MKKSTTKKIEKRLGNLPRYFVDSSVFLELLLEQGEAGECASFFNRAKYKYRLATSLVAAGEVIKAINEIYDGFARQKQIIVFMDLLKYGCVSLVGFRFITFTNISAVRDDEPCIEPADALIFSSAVTENYDALITFDKDYSHKLETAFRIRIKSPSEV